MTATIDRSTVRAPAHQPVPAKRRRRPVSASQVMVVVALAVYAVIAVGPLLLVVFGSFRSTQDILVHPLGLPSPPRPANYSDAWTTGSLGRYVVNSLITTGCAVVLCVGVSLLAAYVLGRWKFRGNTALLFFFTAGLMVPIRIGVVPLFHMFDGVGLVDSRTGLILIYAASGVPLAVLLLTTFFRQVPPELEESARIDGAGELRIFWNVMMPLVRPAVVTITVFNVTPAWNDFFFPLVFLRTPSKYTLPLGISQFFGEHSTDRGLLFAGLVITVAPLIVLFVACTRQIVNGLTAGVGK